ncbi:MAG: GNAT family N-acetyltransferase [Actinomycetota bacterium]|nr:GNAT family N-acetyltransferase [Actinomycetota bacterium]
MSSADVAHIDSERNYEVRLALTENELAQAQLLRHQVFVGEWGAGLAHTHLDVDALDPWCDHLIVRELRTGAVVGTYRLLPPDRATVAGGCYAAAEFDISSLNPIANDLVELGRSCVHPEHRNGAVIGLLWSAVIRYMVAGGHNWLSGCTSVPLADSGIQAASVWYEVSATCLSPMQHRVTPHRPWQPDPNSPAVRAALPPLLRGYLRLGAWVCGPPAHDEEFACADFFMLLDLGRLSPRHRQHFLGLPR